VKRSVLILGVLLALLGAGCGDSGQTDTESDEVSDLAQQFLNAPGIKRPEGPPPKKVVIKEVKPGSGAIAKKGDSVRIHYRGFEYSSGNEVYFEWRPNPPVPYAPLGYIEGEPGLQQGVIGMKEGGRREVIVPARLSSINDALIYLVELVSVEPADQ
jgi:peptidylprolyl isomerase